MPMKAAIPFHRRRSNTSTPPETLTEEEKIAGLGGMILTYPPEMVAIRGCLDRMTEVMSQPLINKGRGKNLVSSGSRKFNQSSATRRRL